MEEKAGDQEGDHKDQVDPSLIKRDVAIEKHCKRSVRLIWSYE